MVWTKCLALVFVVFLVSGCQRSEVEQSIRIEPLFRGYTLLCADDVPANIQIRDLELARCKNTYSDNQVLVPGRVYIFRKDTTIENEDLAITVIPKRLADAGAVVTRSPKDSTDFTHLFIGGPLFSIEFGIRGRRGLIFNKVHTSEQDAGNWEELVAILQ